jgi:hypothetical protein
MRKAAVRHGDPTTTGGIVIAFASGIYDDRKRVALTNDEATCGNCKGTYKIYGTGKGISQKSRNVVVDGDKVLCPCGRNRVLVGRNPGIFLETDGGALQQTRETPVSAGNTPEQWIAFTLKGGGCNEGLQCIAHFADGSTEYGTLDSRNSVRIARTTGSPCIKLELLLDSKQGCNSVTDRLLSAAMG